MIFFDSFVTSMAKDLRQEFYAYFPRFLTTLIGLLNTKEPEQIEWTFYCLAHLFKILKPFLKKDLSIVYNEILPLLNRRRHPEYVTNYAAECFSYVARDIRDKDKFLAMLLSGLKKHVDSTTDCGRLLYEIVKGANHGLHSCAEEFLMNWLKALVNSTIDKNVLFHVLTEFTKHLVQNIYPQNLDVFWKVSFDVLLEFSAASATNDTAIGNILVLLEQAVKFRNGKCVCRLNEVIEGLLTLSNSDLSNATLLQLSQIVAMILLSPNLTVTQLDASRLTKKILSTSEKNIFEDFVWALVNWSQFEVLILPEFLKYFEQHFESELSSFELMTKIILEKSPLCHDGISLDSWKIYRINFKSEETVRHIEKIIRNEADQSDIFKMSLILYPHITGKEVAEPAGSLKSRAERLLKEIPDHETLSVVSSGLDGLRNTIYQLAMIIETVIHINQADTLDLHEITSKLLPYSVDDKFMPTLQILDQLFHTQPKEKLNFALFQTVHSKLESNLSSQSHEVRLLTAHILQYFSKLPELQQPNDSIYEIIYNCENVVTTVQTYRDQLMNLQKLSASMELFRGISGTLCRLDPLR